MDWFIVEDAVQIGREFASSLVAKLWIRLNRLTNNSLKVSRYVRIEFCELRNIAAQAFLQYFLAGPVFKRRLQRDQFQQRPVFPTPESPTSTILAVACSTESVLDVAACVTEVARLPALTLLRPELVPGRLRPSPSSTA